MSRKCTECGSTDIEVDSSRADAVCTNCGAVLESGIIVSDVQFEENAHGGSSALGTFVSSDSKGGKLALGGGGGVNNYVSSIGRESREITLRNARKRIVNLATHLRLRPDHIDMAFYFFKLALSKHLTRGRKSSHVIAACVYITCRTEGTSHMLIDFSDVLQIDVYELGRTYLRLSQALCINIPAMDPCLYVMRFAHRLEFGDKTHEVSMTALRLVSRMKKDWIHFGRRPSGLCGAALLIAARLHEYNRSITDVIKVVKVHESTLRKRLSEFGETPASQLTLDEFMTVDLDAMTEEQDPPSFKVARKKDRERLAELEQDENLEKEMTKLEELIEKELEERKGKIKGPYAKYANSSFSSDDNMNSPLSSIDSLSEIESESEEAMAARFLREEALTSVINTVLDPKEASKTVSATSKAELDSLLMPPPISTPVRCTVSPARNSIISPGMGLRNTVEDYFTSNTKDKESLENLESEVDEELDLTGIDDDEIDSYIMSPQEIKLKTKLWLKLNKDYLLEQEEKFKREAAEREELIKQGKDPDKKRKTRKRPKMSHINNGSAIEAIEKIEKKISTKINYDVLRSLNDGNNSDSKSDENCDNDANNPATQNEDESDVDVTEKNKRVKMELSNPVVQDIKPNSKLVSVKSESNKRNLNLSAFISNKRRPIQENTSDIEENQDINKNENIVVASKDDDSILSQDSGFGTQSTQGTQGTQSTQGTQGDELNNSKNNEANDEKENLDDSFEETEDEPDTTLSVEQLFNRHTGQEEINGYSDMEEDYY